MEKVAGRVVWLSLLSSKLKPHDPYPELAPGRPVAVRFHAEHYDHCPLLRGVVTGGSRTEALTYLGVEILDWQKLARYWQSRSAHGLGISRGADPSDGRGAPRPGAKGAEARR